MIPQDQRVIDFENGDCFASCVASVLDLPREDVPNFAEEPGPSWWTAFHEWLRSRGLAVEPHRSNHGGSLYTPPGYWIGGGKSPRGDHHHAVVFHGCTMAHDPHPSRDGLDGAPTFAYVIVPATEGADDV